MSTIFPRKNRLNQEVFTLKRLPDKKTKTEGSEDNDQVIKIQDQELQAFAIKLQAYDNFVETINQNNQQLIHDFSSKMLKHSSKFNLIAKHATPSSLQQNKPSDQFMIASNDQTNSSCEQSDIHNNCLFVLKIENQKLKCQQKLLIQKIQYEKVLRNQILSKTKQQKQMQMKMKIRERGLLRQQVVLLEELLNKQQKIAYLVQNWNTLDQLRALTIQISQSQNFKQNSNVSLNSSKSCETRNEYIQKLKDFIQKLIY